MIDYIAYNIIHIYIILSLNIYKTNIEVEIHLCVAKDPLSSKYDMITADSRNMHRQGHKPRGTVLAELLIITSVTVWSL